MYIMRLQLMQGKTVHAHVFNMRLSGKMGTIISAFQEGLCEADLLNFELC